MNNELQNNKNIDLLGPESAFDKTFIKCGTAIQILCSRFSAVIWQIFNQF